MINDERRPEKPRMSRIILGFILLMLMGDPSVTAERTNQLLTATELIRGQGVLPRRESP
jgi:hypothetical protein